MKKQKGKTDGMHEEYRVDVFIEASGKWAPYNNCITKTIEDAKRVLKSAMEFMPRKRGFKHRIAVRLVGDWRDFKEENEK